MSLITYKFLNYVANGNGIKFAALDNVKNTARFDHSVGHAPASTKADPLTVLRNSITTLRTVSVPSSCPGGCDRVVPLKVDLSWSGPSAPSSRAEIEAEIEATYAFYRANKDVLLAGFLPTTADQVLTVGE